MIFIEMWNKIKRKTRNCNNLQRVTYRCSEEDLGKQKVSEKDRHKKMYARIFEKQALSHMKERLKTFNQIQSQLKQQNHEEATQSH